MESRIQGLGCKIQGTANRFDRCGVRGGDVATCELSLISAWLSSTKERMVAPPFPMMHPHDALGSTSFTCGFRV